jgi:hypothetical protein
MKKVIYSAVFGIESTFKYLHLPGWDKYILTDQPDKVNADKCWTIKQVSKTHDDNGISNRFYKFISHKIFPDHDYCLYFDSKVILKDDLENVPDKYLNNIATFFKHPSRWCLYQELPIVVGMRFDTQDRVNKIYQILVENQYPRNNGLTENNIFLRSHKNEKLNKALEQVYYMIHNLSRRDQIVFMYCLWKHGCLDDIFFEEDQIKMIFYDQQHISMKTLK